MTLVEVKIDNSVTRQSGPYYFKIQGKLYYLTCALLPHGDQTPIYAQIYILDTADVRGPLICDSGAHSRAPERPCS